MREYKHGNWFCKPANEAEAKEIMDRAVASGAVLNERVKTNGSIGYKWDLFDAWGVHLGTTYTAYTDKGEPFCGAIQYTIEELRQKFPLPGERVEAVEYTHEYSDFGIYKSCSVIVSEPDYDGFVVVHDKHGCYRVVSEGSVRPLRTEREKWIEAAMDVSELRARDGAKQVFGEIYDAIKSGALKTPEVK